MGSKDEADALNALTSFSLNHILGDLEINGAGLSSQLGLSGASLLDQKQIYNEQYDDDGEAYGTDVGRDLEGELDDEDFGEEDVEMLPPQPVAPAPKQKRVHIVKRMVERPKTVHERFPAFEKDKILDFSELFKGYTPKKSRLAKRVFHIETVYPKRKEVPRGFLEGVVGDTQRQVEDKRVAAEVSSGSIEADLRKAIEARENSDLPVSLPLDDRTFDLVLLSNWEDQIIYEPEFTFAQPVAPEKNLTTPANKDLESGIWTQSIIWSPDAPFRDFTQLEIHDEDLVPEEKTVETAKPRKRLRADLVQKDKFNLSNDQFYEVARNERHRVRQTFGQLTVEHAYPAQKLQLPFYKTRLSKQEARSFHRPALQFPTNIELRFTKVRTAKKKKDRAGRKLGKGGNIGEGLHKSGDLSLRDTSNFVLWEYSEEHPPIIPNFGMGSVLVNYYRKKTDEDEHVPKMDLGTPFVLEPQDESPFMKFGSVKEGQTMPALYNNLIRAPLFRHKAYPTDFLVVRHTVKGDTKYFLREIKHLFVLGQTYPVTEVPGPHSRKITNTIKHRLQIIAYKLLRKSQGERLKISRLMKYFPDQNELQMRQRLKEFMEYHRRGPHQGFWRLKETWVTPSDAEMLKMVTPEQVVLSESMQVGQRHLQDSGYTETAEASNNNDDDSHLSIEQQLAPWITTKNFLYATQAKAMLRLHGEGDPSGRGEAFSFIRISMKEIFVKAGEDFEQKMAEAESRPKSAHRYNVAEQQQIYKSEIDRIWKAQFDSLSRKEEPILTEEDENKSKNASVQPGYQSTGQPTSFRFSTAMQLGNAGATTSMFSIAPAAAPSPGMSRASSVDRDAGESKKVLRIKRLVDGEWRTEIVRDPAVIRAYVRGRQAIEEEATLADSLAPTGDAEKDKRAKKRLEEEIARMKKNQERRLNRKNAKIVKEGGQPLLLNRQVKPDTTRRCGHCGAMGHMKTNRKCPRWAEFNAPGTSAAGASASATGAAGAGAVAAPGSAATSPSVPARNPSFSNPSVSSPLAMSPPMTGMEDSSAGGAPKLKLTLKKN